MPDAIDTLLELTPARKMRAKFSGETTDAAHAGSVQAAKIEVTFFRFGSAKSLSKAKAQRERDKLDEEKRDDKDEEADDAQSVRNARERPTEKTGKKEDDFRFQITKQVDKATPVLMQAYYSNSFKPKRQECNSFAEAKLIVRKLGGGNKAHRAYLEMTFRGVYIVGYELETMGKDPPQETIDFCFQTCEMSYAQQLASGDLVKDPNIKGWNFLAQKETATR